MSMRLRAAGFAVAGVFMTSACASQVAALAPVSGDNIYKVRTAATDVLLESGYAIKVAPVCTQEPEAVVCAGSTMDEEAIAVTAPGKGKTTMTVTVGGATVFDGVIQDIIDKAAIQQ